MIDADNNNNNEKAKSAPRRTLAMKILVDEHSDGWDERLCDLGFDAHSVRKLNTRGVNLRTDFSVLNYARQNDMVLLTRDKENIMACRENGIPCVPLDDDAMFKLAVAELEKMRPCTV